MLVMTPFAFSLIFGQAYRPALMCAIVLVFAAAFGGFNIVMEDAFRGLGHPRVPMRSEAAGLVVTAVLLILLLKPLGALGAAVTSLLSYATVSLLLIVNGLKINGTRYVDMLMPRSSEIAADMRHLRSLWPGKSAHNVERVYTSISVQH
jgi:O-antigen/teichoic acid export membrane protein